MSNWLTFTAVAAAVCWTFAPRSRSTTWWVRGFEFPRAQFLALTAIMMLALTVLGEWDSPLQFGAILVLGVCCVAQLAKIAPYTAIFPHQMRNAEASSGDSTVGIMVANVYMPNRNCEGLLRLVEKHNPDVVLTLESDKRWGAALHALHERYPFSVEHPRDNTYGMHLYSRLPLHDSHIQHLVQDDVPSIHTTMTLRNGHQVKLHCVHPAPPSPTENATSDERDAELLIVARDVQPGRDSVIVAGDLNDVAWSNTTKLFQRMSGLLDPRIGRGIYATFHASTPWLRWPLDHLFASADFGLISLDVLEPFGSDHLPVLVFLHHNTTMKKVHDEPQPEKGDHSMVKGKVARVDAEDSAL